jgi:phage terminase large subunit-like protein
LFALGRNASPETVEQRLAPLSPDELATLHYDWQAWARPDQLPPAPAPAGDWTTWLILGGRGAGKTRAGAEWVRALATAPAEAGETARIALVGETVGEVRAVMVEGPSGLLAVHRDAERPRFEPALNRLIWPGGAIAEMFSAETPDRLRGHQFAAAWADELCKWRHAEATWDMLQFGLRIGLWPRQAVTTTPRPMPLLLRMIADPRTVVTRAATHANAANLAPGFLAAIIARYQGTRLGRQEIEAEILTDNPAALWSRGQIEAARVAAAPDLVRIVVGVDPPVSSSAAADACGIVAAGRDGAGRAYVLADATVRGLTPLAWARRAVGVFHDHAADALVVEVNQGGELLRAVIAQVDDSVPVREVRARRGKWLRAEPVAAAYERGRVHHVGAFPDLEDQMCEFEPTGLASGRSPDRLDALVWALSDLLRADTPRVRRV